MTWTLPQPLLLFNRSNCYQLCWPSIPNHPHIWNARMVNARDQFKKCCSWSIDTCKGVRYHGWFSVILHLENIPKKDSLDMTLRQCVSIASSQQLPTFEAEGIGHQNDLSKVCAQAELAKLHASWQLRSAEQQEIEEHLPILAPACFLFCKLFRMATPYRSFLKSGYTHYPIMDDPFVFLTKNYNPHKSQLYKQSECFPSLPEKEPKKTTPKSVKWETDVARQESIHPLINTYERLCAPCLFSMPWSFQDVF